jgi:hypothetical protein
MSDGNRANSASVRAAFRAFRSTGRHSNQIEPAPPANRMIVRERTAPSQASEHRSDREDPQQC